ncbi:uncharacterized protein [Argopecten irradians]|uniref:uncharacterized protein n=1 Tax=Argopecten irradians TaxID=31199 RepID=UPI00371345D8
MSSWEDYLKDIYFNPANAGSFSGPDKLYRYVKKAGKYVISKYKIRKWLQRQEPYSLQRAIRHPFKRNKIFVTGIDDQWSADLMDMVKFKSENDGYSYILVVIDVFSKYLWLRPLKNKKGTSVSKALQDILSEGRQPSRIRSDKGQEFRSKDVNSLLNRYGITHLYAQNETKAAVAERVIKTIKTRLYRYFTHNRNYEYVKKLQSLIATIRHITGRSNPFTREYDQRWTGEIFSISQKVLRGGLPLYRVKDYDGDEIKGTFYQSELQKVGVRDDDMWKVETILKTKGKGQNKQYYVKWLHWPKKFNSWIYASDLTDL